jgi:hypothetical protein
MLLEAVMVKLLPGLISDFVFVVSALKAGPLARAAPRKIPLAGPFSDNDLKACKRSQLD